MLTMWECMSIITLWKKGESLRSIARLLNLDRKTVRKAVRQYDKTGKDELPKIVRASKIDAYKDQIVSYLEKDLSCIRIHEELRAIGATIKYSTLTRYVADTKVKGSICVRFHTEAGQEAQVDFGYVSLQPDESGKRRKAYAFCMTLSYSRLAYVEIVFSQQVKTFVQCHVNAFRYFGGVPETVKIDNLKSGVLDANFFDPVYNRLYKQFSEHYGFSVIACRVREPQEKGKIEAGVKFVKNNFCAGRRFNSQDEMVSKLKLWLETTCNNRIHGTIKKIPRELFATEEKPKLKILPVEDFVFPEIIRRPVYKDCHITLKNNYYSVPYKFVGKTVDVLLDGKLVKVLFEGETVAIHIESQTSGEFITNKDHYPKHKNFDLSSDEYRSEYSNKMKAIGANAGEMFKLILAKQPYDWYRSTSGIIHLKKVYADTVIDAACKRAIGFDLTNFTAIKNICKTGSYTLPMEEKHETTLN
jgi:transposase